MELPERIGIRLCLWPALFATAAITSCDVAQTDSLNSGDPPGRDGGPSQYDRVREQYEPLIARLPPERKVDEVDEALDALLSAAGQEKWGEDKDPRLAIIHRYPDDDLSLYLLDTLYREKKEGPAEDALEILRSIRAASTGSRIEGKAAYLELELERERSPQRFLALCEKWASDEEITAQIALYSRLTHYVDQGRRKEATQDSLHLWARFPEVVERMEMGPSLTSHVRQGGFLLEAAALEHSPNSAKVAKLLWLRDSALGGTGASTSDSAMEVNSAYFTGAPDYSLLEEAISARKLSREKALLYSARLATLAFAQDDFETSLKHIESFQDHLDPLLDDISRGFSLENPLLLRALLHGFAVTFTKSLRGRESERAIASILPPSVSPSIYRRSIRRISWANASLAEAIERGNAAQNRSEFRSAADAHIERMETIGDHQGVIEALTVSAAAQHDSDCKGRYLMRLGNYYMNSMSLPDQAVKIYLDIEEEFSDAPYAPSARLKATLAYFDLERYEEAYAASGEFLVRYPEDTRIATCLFLMASSESALGFAYDAVQRMQKIAREYPESREAPRAIFWLGTHALSSQDYAEALTHFEDLATRYPDDTLARQAKTYISRIRSIENAEGRVLHPASGGRN